MKNVTSVIFLLIALSHSVASCLAQQEPPEDNSAMFISSVDANLSVPFSSVDAARRSRPPQPTKIREDLWYPTGFLTLSTPTSEEVVQKGDVDETSTSNEKLAVPFRPIDSSVETTPYSQVPVVKESTKKKGDSALFFALSIAIAGLGVFLYYDFLYKNQLKEDLVQNAKLCSSKAVSADFEEVLARAPELTDPREPSHVDPTFDPDALFFEETSSGQSGLLKTESFEASGRKIGAGVGLTEENFDFAPKGLGLVNSVDEVVEDFVVGKSASS